MDYKMFVKPDKPVVDYLTCWSGITAKALIKATASFDDVQAHVLSLFSATPILIDRKFKGDTESIFECMSLGAWHRQKATASPGWRTLVDGSRQKQPGTPCSMPLHTSTSTSIIVTSSSPTTNPELSTVLVMLDTHLCQLACSTMIFLGQIAELNGRKMAFNEGTLTMGKSVEITASTRTFPTQRDLPGSLVHPRLSFLEATTWYGQIQRL
ncbi:hypothetical protein C8Q74DRAFT_1374191 [Fomes fomentarius]|nr:hypothetical protein C8Q74DRAFT_1374191 [Fomes fomentarius]